MSDMGGNPIDSTANSATFTGGSDCANTIAAVRAAADGTVDLTICSAMVTYVGVDRYFLQQLPNGPAIAVDEGSPIRSASR